MLNVISGPLTKPDAATIKEQQERALLHQMHRQWLELPITKALLVAVSKIETNIINSLGDRSLQRDYPTEHFRLLAAQLSNVKQINKLITDANSLITNSQNS